MLGWCIVILVGARLKASVQFPPLKGMYQKEALARGATLIIEKIFFMTLLYQLGYIIPNIRVNLVASFYTFMSHWIIFLSHWRFLII